PFSTSAVQSGSPAHAGFCGCWGGTWRLAEEGMRPIRFGLVLGFAATSLFALQEATTVQQQQRVQGGERQEEKKLPELSSEQRRRASKLLQDAAANSADLSPAMRAYALSQIARAYSRTQ